MQKESRRCTTLEGDICFCSIEGIMGILSKKWALLIISAIGNNQKLRYGELEKKLVEISPKTLADRLKEL
ncbi:MAG: winged helix-turn-helix transcriptional regulator, partial [Candidatus Methanoperedens sp.]|nr:winged helix-turn-helix transcriptional regulator [Candidatus Methanoperedens sp.]